MSSNDESSSRYFGDSLQLTNWILYSGATSYMTPLISYFIPGLLEDTDKYIEVVEVNYVTAKQRLQVQIIMYNNNGNNFIAMLHDVLLAPDLCDRLFLIIKLIHLGHTYLFHKGFYTVYFCDKKKNAATLPNSAQSKHAFLFLSQKYTV